ncbi:AraC-like DNA-binding protein [Rhodococcus sp. 27YEA15]|uniref:helix-turn-helix domain-containing protein n=1 Tax=Rhodococcus sp. 27YEA15 TaxID=3156259 RepID=UPI003C7B85EB
MSLNPAKINLSTDAVDPEDVSDYWRSATRPFFITEPAGLGRLLQGSITASPIGSTLIGETTFNSQNYIRNRALITESGLDDQYMIQAVVDGYLHGTTGNMTFVARPGDIVFFDLGRPWSARAEVDATRTGRTLSLLVPRLLMDAASDGRRLHGTVLHGTSAAVLARCLRSILRALPHLDTASAAGYENVVVSLLRATLGAGENTPRPPASLDLRDQAMEYVSVHLTEPSLNPAAICVALSVSRAQLYRAFEADGGVAHVIRRQRLAQTYREITNPDMPFRSIEVIATSSGFGTKAQFVRAFKEYYGVTPTRARSENRQNLANPSLSRLYAQLSTFERRPRHHPFRSTS